MITSTAVSVVATLLSIPMSTTVVLVDVMSSVVLASIVDEALLDGKCFLASRRRLLMNRYLPLGLLSCHHVEQTLHLISNVSCLGV
jgi:hypothetical protein